MRDRAAAQQRARSAASAGREETAPWLRLAFAHQLAARTRELAGDSLRAGRVDGRRRARATLRAVGAAGGVTAVSGGAGR